MTVLFQFPIVSVSISFLFPTGSVIQNAASALDLHAKAVAALLSFWVSALGGLR